jgi:pimeloyl-ACP methyl ester carboxylesterase
MKYLDLHGDRVAYREAGAGEALLLIHGMAGSSATWRAILPQLSKKIPGGGTGPVRAR